MGRVHGPNKAAGACYVWHLVVTEMQEKNNTLFGLPPLLGLFNHFGSNRQALQASGLFFLGGGRGGTTDFDKQTNTKERGRKQTHSQKQADDLCTVSLESI